MSSTCFEDGYTYIYGMVRFTCISLSSLVGRTVCLKLSRRYLTLWSRNFL